MAGNLHSIASQQPNNQQVLIYTIAIQIPNESNTKSHFAFFLFRRTFHNPPTITTDKLDNKL